MSGRRVTVVLATGDDGVLGSLPPLDVPSPHWQETDDVVRAVHAAHDVKILVLRLLDVRSTEPMRGGEVTYLAEPFGRTGDLPLQPWRPAAGRPDPLEPHPLRAAYASPGGPAAELGWAQQVLASRGIRRTGPVGQLRTWNLSAVFALPTDAGTVWLKCVPAFFAHEGPLLAALDAGGVRGVPTVLAAEPGRVLMADVPGPDHYEATAQVAAAMLPLLVDLQVACAGRLAELAALGVPARGRDEVLAAVGALVDRVGPELDDGTRASAVALLEGLPARLDAIATCGLPATVVHGDFHGGNARGPVGDLVLLDWGDSALGDPATDLCRLRQGRPADVRRAADEAAARAWTAAVPGSDPLLAARLAEPLAPLLSAVQWQLFLDGIEPDERVYHAGDPAAGIRAAVAAARPPSP